MKSLAVLHFINTFFPIIWAKECKAQTEQSFLKRVTQFSALSKNIGGILAVFFVTDSPGVLCGRAGLRGNRGS